MKDAASPPGRRALSPGYSISGTRYYGTPLREVLEVICESVTLEWTFPKEASGTYDLIVNVVFLIFGVTQARQLAVF